MILLCFSHPQYWHGQASEAVVNFCPTVVTDPFQVKHYTWKLEHAWHPSLVGGEKRKSALRGDGHDQM